MLFARNGPLGLGDLLDGAFRIYRAHFVRLTLLAALFYVPLGILSTLLFGTAIGGQFSLIGMAVNEPFYGDNTEAAVWTGVVFLLSIFALSVLNVVCSILAYLSLTVQVLTVADGKRPPILQSIRQGASHFWRFVGMAFVGGIALSFVASAVYLALMFFMFMFVMLAGVLLAPVSDNEMVLVGVAGFTLLVSLGMVVLVLLPLAALASRWTAAPVTIVAERTGPVSALTRSWRLTERHTWRGILYVILLAILNLVVLGLPMTLLQWLLLVVMTPDLFGAVGGLLTGIGYLINVLWQPFLAAALALYYFDLRVRRESYDLELRLATVEAELRPVFLP